MLAVFKRDLRAYFTSPIGYVFIAVFLLLANLFFYMYNILAQSSDLSSLFANLLFVLSFLIPILTMRLFSEELKAKTDQMLLTAPVRVGQIVLGKYLACLSVFIIALICTLTWPLIVTMYGTPALYTIVGNYAALFFAVMAFIAIGLFISSLTESQIVAAIITFAVYLGLYLMNSLTTVVDNNILRSIMEWVSVFSRYKHFALGVFSLADIVYYISLTVIFLFLTTRVLEKKRWA
ncbi:MAG: ABC transporter permease subunit [Eubacteriales bacterium]|jgi:ABC-2 type transport system permease protein